MGTQLRNIENHTCGAVEPLLLYCAPAFQDVLDKKWAQAKLFQIQRGFLLRITRAFRTTSTDAVSIIAGIEPLHLAALSKSKRSGIKKKKYMSH